MIAPLSMFSANIFARCHHWHWHVLIEGHAGQEWPLSAGQEWQGATLAPLKYNRNFKSVWFIADNGEALQTQDGEGRLRPTL